MSQKEQDLIALGVDADNLLKNETFNKVLNRMVDGSFATFTSTKPEEKEKREKAYDHYRALVDIISTLKQDIQVKDEIEAKNKDLNSSKEE